MNIDASALIHALLDDVATDEEFGELDAWLRDNSENARIFANAVLLHDRLMDRARIGLVLEDVRRVERVAISRRFRLATMFVVIAFLATFGLYRSLPSGGGAVAAEKAASRLRLISSRLGDRSYRVGSPQAPERQSLPLFGGPPSPLLDGAILHVRGRDQFVLERRLENGTPFVTGGNSRMSWRVPPTGPVEVSSDPARFRGGVPGKKHGLLFLDAESSLDHLSFAYELELASEDDKASGRAIPLGRRRLKGYLGPETLSIHFDERTGVIRHIQLKGMPRLRGKPQDITLELVEERPLGEEFFDHRSHHAPDRAIVLD